MVMAGLQSFTRKHLTTILLVLLAGGFAVLLAELILYKHFEGLQLVGLFSTIAGLLAALWGLVAKGGTRIALAGVMVLLAVAGVIGVLQHNGGGSDDEAARPAALTAVGANVNTSFAAQDSDEAPGDTDDGGRPEGDAGTPPPLAPLGLSGLALMGAVVLLAKRDPDEAVLIK